MFKLNQLGQKLPLFSGDWDWIGGGTRKTRLLFKACFLKEKTNYKEHVIIKGKSSV